MQTVRKPIYTAVITWHQRHHSQASDFERHLKIGNLCWLWPAATGWVDPRGEPVSDSLSESEGVMDSSNTSSPIDWSSIWLDFTNTLNVSRGGVVCLCSGKKSDADWCCCSWWWWCCCCIGLDGFANPNMLWVVWRGEMGEINESKPGGVIDIDIGLVVCKCGENLLEDTSFRCPGRIMLFLSIGTGADGIWMASEYIGWRCCFSLLITIGSPLLGMIRSSWLWIKWHLGP